MQFAVEGRLRNNSRIVSVSSEGSRVCLWCWVIAGARSVCCVIAKFEGNVSIFIFIRLWVSVRYAHSEELEVDGVNRIFKKSETDGRFQRVRWKSGHHRRIPLQSMQSTCRFCTLQYSRLEYGRRERLKSSWPQRACLSEDVNLIRF